MTYNINSQNQPIISRAVSLACADLSSNILRDKTNNNQPTNVLRDKTNRVRAETLNQVRASKNQARASHSLLSMPQDILGTIFQCLTIRDISVCSQLCKSKQIKETLENQFFWQSIYTRHFKSCLPPNKNFPVNYRQMCQNLYISRPNILNGTYSFNILKMSTGSPITLMAFDGKICASSYEHVNIWNQNTLECVRDPTHTLNIGYHLSLAGSGEKLYAGYNDKIKVWDINTGKCLSAFEEYQGQVSCLTIFNGQLYASYGNKIMVLDADTGECLKVLYEHSSKVTSLIIFYNWVCSGFLDGTIMIFDLKSEECAILKEHTGAILSLTVRGNKLFSSSYDETIKIWCVESKECLRTIKGKSQHLTVVSEMLFASPWGTKMTVWDINEEECVKTFEAHHATTSLVSMGTTLISSYYDGHIIVRNFAAKDPEIFNQLVHLFRSSDPFIIQKAMNLFRKMPQKAKNKIYEKLYFLLTPFSNDYFRCGEDAFLEQRGLSSTPEQKAQAIENYLKPPNHYLIRA